MTENRTELALNKHVISVYILILNLNYAYVMITCVIYSYIEFLSV